MYDLPSNTNKEKCTSSDPYIEMIPTIHSEAQRTFGSGFFHVAVVNGAL